MNRYQKRIKKVEKMLEGFTYKKIVTSERSARFFIYRPNRPFFISVTDHKDYMLCEVTRSAHTYKFFRYSSQLKKELKKLRG